MNRSEFEAWCVRHDYKRDAYGHYQKIDRSGSVRRMKLSKVAARNEVKHGTGWLRITSGYYSSLTLNERDQLVGMKP